MNCVVHLYEFMTYSGIKDGLLTIRMQEHGDGEYELHISDNGKGIPEEIDIFNCRSLGMQIVTSLVKDLKGSIEVKRVEGTEFSIKFKETRIE